MKRHNSPLTSRSLRSPLVLGTPLVLLLAGALAACAEAEPRELGFTQSAQDLANVPTEPFFEEASEFVGRWQGTAEDPLALDADGSVATYRFPSGSSRIAVELSLDNGNLVGSITFGEGAPLPPATNPDVGYPAGVAYDRLLGYEARVELGGSTVESLLSTHHNLPPFEGQPYRLGNTSGWTINDGPLLLADGVASLSFSTFEPLEGWCALQTAHPLPAVPGSFSCMPEHGGGFETLGDGTGALCDLYGPPITDSCLPDLSNLDECYQPGPVVEQINCDKVTMCLSNFCECDELGCRASTSDDRLTLRRVGDELVGLLEHVIFKNPRGLSTPLGEVRFQRVQ